MFDNYWQYLHYHEIFGQFIQRKVIKWFYKSNGMNESFFTFLHVLVIP